MGREVGAARTLRFAAQSAVAAADEVVVVLDTSWTPDLGVGTERVISVRDAIGEALASHDPIAASSAILDDWAETSGVVERLTVQGVSLWFLVRLRTWEWLQERLIWAWVVRATLDATRPSRVIADVTVSPALRDILELMSANDGLQLDMPQDATPPPPAAATARTAQPVAAAPGPRRHRAFAPGLKVWLRRRFRPSRPSGPGSEPSVARRASTWLAFVRDRRDQLGREPTKRLLVVSHHVPQVIETPAGRRVMNAYLGTVADRLRGSRLEPILLDMTARRTVPSSIERVTAPDASRTLPLEALMVDDAPVDPQALDETGAMARGVSAIDELVPVAGIDLGTRLAHEVGEGVAQLLPGKLASIDRIGRLLDRLPVAGLLVADEYHRQDWMIAAGARGLPVAAIQHGVIHKNHPGYGHRRRPAQLRLPDRTYVYGRWERALLIDNSVYRDDEVVVGGSPRLDELTSAPGNRATIRSRLGVAEGDRLVVLSGTHGDYVRWFHYPVALAKVFDRPLPRVHLVVKLHPAEDDRGPYRSVIEGVARARGFAPPPITEVRDVDLYSLLAAADAHLGIHSTVLTEAVLVGTPNLLAAVTQGGDLLGYVDAGVALPVANGAQLLDALDAAANGAITEAARAAFVAIHFEPGSASDRIADDLLAWLP